MMDYRTYRTGENNDVLVMEISGHLDNDTSEYFLECLDSIIEDGDKNVVIDCGQLKYISSLGIGTMIRIHSRMKGKGGNVRLAQVDGMVADILRAVHVEKLLNMYPSVEEARASF